MKTIREVLFIFVIILIFSSCFSPWGGDTGTFSISIGGSGSGRYMWNGIETDNLVHVISLEGPGPKQDKTVLRGVRTVQFSVVPGLWNITIKAYNGEVKDENLVAVGSEAVDIKPGPNDTITITMGAPKNTLFEMVFVPGGSFQMGDDGYIYSRPVHTVTLSDFYIGKYEVTQEQYEAVMGINPSGNTTGADEGEVQEKRPVENVSWADTIEFCNKLSSLEGLTPVYTITGTTVTADWSKNGYRLPTEAQWEYAARGGNGSPGNYTYAGSNDPNEVAWYSDNSGGKTHEVGKKTPNGLGLHDMSGNVWEWCWDWYGEYTNEDKTDPTGPSLVTDRVQRGGGWDNNTTNPDGNIRSAYRKGYGGRYLNLGFRVVLPAQSSVEPGTPGLVFVPINNNTAYRVWRGSATGAIVIPAYYNGLPVTSIGYSTDTTTSGAFGETAAVTSITFARGSQLTTIDRYAFYNCTGLTSIILPNTVTFIGIEAFTCTSLTSVHIPAGVTSIGQSVFANCTGLTSVTLPANLTTINTQAFYGCTGLTSITIPASVTEIGGGAFYNCNSLGSITIPEGVTSIGGNAFGSCTSLESITLPANVTSIGNSAFSNCTGLTNITIPESVTEIGAGAFSGCTNLTSVTFEGAEIDFFDNSFPGDLRTKYFDTNGGVGTYTRESGGDAWTTQTTVSDAGIVIELWESEDEKILATDNEFTIYRNSKEPNSFRAIIKTDHNYHPVQWFILGATVGEGLDITINAANYPAGTYQLVVMVYKGGEVPYSAEILFTVEE